MSSAICAAASARLPADCSSSAIVSVTCDANPANASAGALHHVRVNRRRDEPQHPDQRLRPRRERKAHAPANGRAPPGAAPHPPPGPAARPGRRFPATPGRPPPASRTPVARLQSGSPCRRQAPPDASPDPRVRSTGPASAGQPRHRAQLALTEVSPATVIVPTSPAVVHALPANLAPATTPVSQDRAPAAPAHRPGTRPGIPQPQGKPAAVNLPRPGRPASASTRQQNEPEVPDARPATPVLNSGACRSRRGLRRTALLPGRPLPAYCPGRESSITRIQAVAARMHGKRALTATRLPPR
jgi:hypothetical protein